MLTEQITLAIWQTKQYPELSFADKTDSLYLFCGSAVIVHRDPMESGTH